MMNILKKVRAPAFAIAAAAFVSLALFFALVVTVVQNGRCDGDQL